MMGIVASNPCLFMFSIGTLIGARGAYYLLKRIGNKTTTNESGDPSQVKDEPKDPYGDYRMIVAIRTDLKMQKGKAAAQFSHGAIDAYVKAYHEKPKTLRRWLRNGCAKIAVKVNSEEELLELDRAAKEHDVVSSIVRDSGQTQVAPLTRTVIAIGPGPRTEIDKITGHLKLY